MGRLAGGVQVALGLGGGCSLPLGVAQLRGGADLQAGRAGLGLHGGLAVTCCSGMLCALSPWGPSRGRGRLCRGFCGPGVQKGPGVSSSDGLVGVGCCTVHAGLGWGVSWVGGIPLWGYGSLLGDGSSLQLPHQSSTGGLHTGWVGRKGGKDASEDKGEGLRSLQPCCCAQHRA